MNSKQKEIITKAKAYKERTYMALPFARQYLNYCDEEYVTYDRFLRLVKDNENVVEMPTKVEPIMQLDDFFEIIKSQLIGKGA